eukprot:Seg128.4 transcript_id=Seg128.4/GoldUCD/mRNA.D3Y31 product="hypothetical protein" protein_id=Seg128.4/GoldUCD/D3Y31
MTEGALRSFDPLAYWVNDVGNLDREIVEAHKNNDTAKINKIFSEGNPWSFDVFICSDGFHAFLFIVPVAIEQPAYGPDLMSDDPFKVPDLLLCWRIELQYEQVTLQTYQISKKGVLFKNAKKDIKKSYYIGRYENVKNVKCFDLACLQAAPHHYNAILKDCVEFAKEFCMCLLSYCENARKLEKDVLERIKKVSATGLSIERLSRNSFLSGIFGNISLGGLNMSSFIAGPRVTIAIIFGFIFFLIYPIFIALAVVYFMRAYGL